MEMPDDSQHPSSRRTCLCRPLYIPRTKPSIEVSYILKNFHVTDDLLKEYMRLLMIDLHKGLAKNTHARSVVKCFPTYIQRLPSGNEKGKFLALDLGGTHFRVLVIELQRNHFEMTSRTFVVPPSKMVGSGKDLFDHVAACLHVFILEQKLELECLPLGFTFSFPLVQKALDRGIISRWTKGFACDDVIGEDVVKLLQDALSRRGILKNVKVKAVINDTVGTLMACAWKSPYCKVGLIVGTGTNACYVEKQRNAEMFDERDEGSGVILINTEWGAFGDDGSLDFLRCPEDNIIDSESINPGKQIHEKMISGMYMGELVRLLILKCIRAGCLFNGKSTPQLNTKDAFQSNFVSAIENDKVGTHKNCRDILSDLGVKNVSEQDLNNVRYICESVSRRSAFMCAAGICTLIKKVEEKRVTVGVDGSVYRLHPYFHYLMMEKMKQLIKPGVVVSNNSPLPTVLCRRIQTSNSTGGETVELHMALFHSSILRVDGGLYSIVGDQLYRPGRTAMCNSAVSLTFDLTLSEDGSGRGAALTAASAL